MPIKVLLADDSELVRRGIRSLLRSQPEIELVGEAADFRQTIRMMNELKPQVVVLDLHMPDRTETSLLDVKSHLNHDSRVLPMSLSNDPETKALADSLGTLPLLDKMELCDKLIPTIMQLVSPRKYDPPYLSFLKPD
jgi:DNA-binding NarL/FixJ family response regulator